MTTPFTILRRIIPDGFASVRDTLVDLVDGEGCDLVLTTGGTGPSVRPRSDAGGHNRGRRRASIPVSAN